jgi:hypothetical protein
VTVPLAETEEQVVAVFVMITLYTPAIVEVNEATFPGFVAPEGTVHAYEYGPAIPGVAVIVAAVPAQTVGEFTVTVGKALTVRVPEAELEEHEVIEFVMTTL